MLHFSCDVVVGAAYTAYFRRPTNICEHINEVTSLLQCKWIFFNTATNVKALLGR